MGRTLLPRRRAPGKTTRQLNARRYIFTLLAGANLANARHRLAVGQIATPKKATRS
ncbi:hypothetical protein [Micromonospora sp. NPDC050200]|uniref:hypothetical protein n=1 Tax=Micromonospora sp. NPDC050200 TaxID=3155664 RepID=UPI0034054E84